VYRRHRSRSSPRIVASNARGKEPEPPENPTVDKRHNGDAVTESDIAEVLEALSAHGCRFWIAGGWGVDALVGVRTREHRDLDLAIDDAVEADALRALHALGYEVETDWRPARVELGADGGRWVDLHPVRFDARGHGRQADGRGGQFEYPAGCFTTGRIGGSVVPCLSASLQLRFREGHDLRDVDRHDIGLLTAIARRGREGP
jgi:lincosamide nucleotidyltransferase A/C/D/E